MTLFDYRTDHFDDENELQRAQSSPTFMYAMPLEGNRIFFEETSLVARPAVSFQECKDRCLTRLKHLGIEVTDIEEEEFCYIPMGGPLPLKDQRIVGFGGAAAMVHPSTGYHLCRCLMAATDVASTLRTQLASSSSSSSSQQVNVDQVAAEAYHAIWSPQNIGQRHFAVFGGEFLMKQRVEGLRGFFDGFFRLSLETWGGFLAGWPGLPNNEKHETWAARIWFGLTFVSKLPPTVALDMLTSIISYTFTDGLDLIQSVTPLLGEPTPYLTPPDADVKYRIGDVAAKTEAMRMILASQSTEEVPVAFFESTNQDDDTTSQVAATTPTNEQEPEPEVKTAVEPFQ
jgi:lycopene beta-cyclase